MGDMSLNLPPPDKTQLPRPPLELAVCQVRFEETHRVSDHRFGLDIHKALDGRNGLYPHIQSRHGQSMNLQVGPGGLSPSVTPLQAGWQMSSEDESWSVVFMPSSVSLETTKYTTWSADFKPRLAELLRVASRFIDPATEQRLGLRYVDRITEPIVSAPQQWHDYIAPELLGVILHPGIGSAVMAAQQQVQLDLGNDIHSILRHGFVPDPARETALNYALDFDIYREGMRAFDVKDIMEAADGFHQLALQLFQQAIPPKMLAYLATRRESDE